MTTRQPLTEAEKAYLAERHAAGASYLCIEQELGCAVETVRKHARRQRDHHVPRVRGRPFLRVAQAVKVNLRNKQNARLVSGVAEQWVARKTGGYTLCWAP